MAVCHQPPVDKPASQATHTRELEHLLFEQLIQLGEGRPALAAFLCKVANGVVQGCGNLSFLGSIWPLLQDDLGTQPSRAARSCGLTAPCK